MVRLLALLMLNPASAASFGCAGALLDDARFRWFDWPELHRQPPDLFTRKGPTLLALRFDHLPGGLTPDEAHFFRGVFDLLRDRVRVLRALREIAAGARTRAELIQTMSTLERRHGFGVVEVHEALSGAAWTRIIAAGNTVIDHADVRLTLGGEQAPAGRWVHGSLSHRLQLHLVLREIARHPERFGRPLEVRALYQKMGDRAWTRGLDWSQTGVIDDRGRADAPLNLFYHLFDSAENNPSSPGYFSEYRKYWPDLPLDR